MPAGVKTRVNVKSTIDPKKIRNVKLNGRDVIIVPSATLPDDVIMNGIKYPAHEIASSFMGLNRTPAPLSHPVNSDGVFLSALDPEGLNVGYFGAYNDNARQENGRVLVDKIIDVNRAKESEMGRRVLEAIDKGDPIHTSTGLYCHVENVDGDDTHDKIARNIVFDHDAILLDEEGAATPEQGVGMMVNEKTGESENVPVVNSSLSDMVDSDIDWAGMHLIRMLDERENVSRWEKLKSVIFDVIGAGDRETEANEDDMDDEKFDKLSADVATVTEAVANMTDTIADAVKAAVAPINEHIEALTNAKKASDEAEHATAVAAVVNKQIMSEDVAKETPLIALNHLLNASGGKAAAINGGLPKSGDATQTYDTLPEE